jgi:hypothetical protein
MTEKEKILFEILNSFSGSIAENRKSTLEIINTNVDLINTVYEAKVEFPNWKVFIETLISKITYNSYSIVELSKGYYIHYKNEKKYEVIDYSSIYSLTRTLIENYLTLYYIYLDNISESEKLFRFKLWETSGLISRQSFELPKNTSDLYKEAKEKKEREKIAIEKLKKEIEQMEEFKQLDKRELRKFETYGLPRIESWHSLLEKSNLKKEYFATLYSIFSAYTHSEYISILQIKQGSFSPKNENTTSNTMLCLYITKIINSLVIEYLLNNFKSVEIIYNMKPLSLRKNIEFTLKLGKKTSP